GAFMFPIGLFCMTKAARQGQAGDVFGVALVAAAIKSVNLFFPHLTPVSTLHPMIAILLQSAFGYAFIQGLKKSYSPFLLVPAAVVGWRIAFIGVQVLFAGIQGQTAGVNLSAMFAGSLIDIALVSLLLVSKPSTQPRQSVSFASLALVLAISVQGIITAIA
ncbi:MAG TPA: hypothetical protein PLD82_03470, partial [Spirochaetota bacterium]|nr:hypothetical protein [Spirochaetota bacterium]